MPTTTMSPLERLVVVRRDVAEMSAVSLRPA